VRIAGLLDHSRACRNLRLAFPAGTGGADGVRLEFLSSWRELREGVREGLYDLAIVQPCLGTSLSHPEPNLAELEPLAGAWPREKVILYFCCYFCCPHPSASLLHDLGRLGFPFLLILGTDDDPRNICRIVARAGARSTFRKRLADLEPAISEEALRLVLETVAGWPPSDSVHDLASSLNMSRRSLNRRFRTEGLPSPGRLVSFARLLETSALWNMGLRSRARIASILGLSSPASLGHLSRSLAGRPLGSFLEPRPGEDPFDWVIRKIQG
jgi:AraC-like DNA-binding protein